MTCFGAFFRIGAQLNDNWAIDWQASASTVAFFSYARMNLYVDYTVRRYFSAALGPIVGYLSTLFGTPVGLFGGSARLAVHFWRVETNSLTVGFESDVGTWFDASSSGAVSWGPPYVAGYFFFGGQYTADGNPAPRIAADYSGGFGAP